STRPQPVAATTDDDPPTNPRDRSRNRTGVLAEREEKNSVAIAFNESFGSWTKTFTDPRLCAAIVDRLTFNGTIIETGTDSYRLASTRARAAEPAKAS
ncbi:ATP-binding protein, partial [Streptomyces sp. NPDC003860]